MNGAHYHLLVNHLPIIIPIAGLLILILGFVFHSEVIKRTAYFLFIVAAVTTAAASATGESAAEAIKHMPGIDENMIHAHEEQSEIFAVLNYLLGALSLVALLTSWYSIAKWLSWVVAALSLAVLFYAQQTGSSGGVIRHSEIRSTSVGTPAKTTYDKNGD